MASVLNIGVSALVANQSALATTGHNIANANTPGYSRQQNIFGTLPAGANGDVFVGNGVGSTGIRRIYDEFVVAELRTNTSNLSRLESFFDNASQLDDLFGNADTGLANSMANFFSALQTASEDPASIPARQLVMSETQVLSNRFLSLQEQLETRNQTVAFEMSSVAAEITTLSSNIAELNKAIIQTGNADAGNLPNDLLDQRDEALRQLSELVSVQVVETSNNQVSVFVGNGQALVIAAEYNTVLVANGDGDDTRKQVILRSHAGDTTITESISGGRMGGLLDFRDQVLDPTQNRLGQIAVGLVDTFNEQHQLGMDLDGELGGNLFLDMNSTEAARRRVFPNVNNTAPANGVIEVYIDDAEELTVDDYEIRFPPTSTSEFTVHRRSTGEELFNQAFSGTLPSIVEVEGLRIELTSGTFSAGDQFVISPTRYASREMGLQVDDVRNLAFAQPVRAISNTSNRGSGNITSVDMTDTSTSMFSTNPGQLSPPLLIEFTSATTYDVLDVSDPTNPVQLVPPIRNQNFVPGLSNEMLPGDDSRTAAVSSGPDVGVVTRNAADGTYLNGYSAEQYIIVYTDPVTSSVSTTNLTSNANDSAQTIADTLSTHSGITATASNWAQISNISSATPMVLTLNGQVLAGVDANTLTDSINSNPTLTAAGITALSDGTTMTLFGSTGDDFQIDVGGVLATDSVTVTDRHGTSVTLAANGVAPATTPNATIGGQVEVFMDEGVELFTNTAGVFNTTPTAVATHLGFQITMTGQPSVGDRFSIDYNTGGSADNRNVLALSQIQSRGILNQGAQTISETNGLMVETIGSFTNEAKITTEAAEALLEQSVRIRESVSGVNLDEEAAKMIEFEMGYNAAAQVINIARGLFDTLLNAVG